jgi:hypothetical protein
MDQMPDHEICRDCGAHDCQQQNTTDLPLSSAARCRYGNASERLDSTSDQQICCESANEQPAEGGNEDDGPQIAEIGVAENRLRNEDLHRNDEGGDAQHHLAVSVELQPDVHRFSSSARGEPYVIDASAVARFANVPPLPPRLLAQLSQQRRSETPEDAVGGRRHGLLELFQKLTAAVFRRDRRRDRRSDQR